MEMTTLKTNAGLAPLWWQGPSDALENISAECGGALGELTRGYYVLKDDQGACYLTDQGEVTSRKTEGSLKVMGLLPGFSEIDLGSKAFCQDHHTACAYYAGAMALGIASREMVIALGQQGLMGSFGTGGLTLEEVESALQAITTALPQGPFAFNLLFHPQLERETVALYLKYNVRCIEAAAYMTLTRELVYYRVKGLTRDRQGRIQGENKIIAKISNANVARQFMQPAPLAMVQQLSQEGLVSQQQVQLSQLVPVAGDITAEADSGGHTDNKPLIGLIPELIALRNGIQREYGYAEKIRIGAAGGIGTPASALGALMLGADYLVTGSINQCCVEAGTSPAVKSLLAQADMSDVMMTPSSDMFEMGARVQVLKKGTLYPMHAQKLHHLYQSYDAIEAIPEGEIEKLEKRVFKKSLETVWEETKAFFSRKAPSQLVNAQSHPKAKMAMIFKWYLGQSARWACAGDKERQLDYQIWCGPGMASFNRWTRQSFLEKPENRDVVNVAYNILKGAAYLHRIRVLQYLGCQVQDDLAEPRIQKYN